MIRTTAGVRIPDTRLANDATELVQHVSPQSLFNHCLRSYIFAASIGRKLGKSFDEELLYVATIMHDLGLVDPYIGDARFEIDGADAAKQFLTQQAYPAGKIAVVWDAIVLHASMEIAQRKETEVALLQMGVFMDGGLMGVEQFPASFYEEVYEAIPGLNSTKNLLHLLGEVLKRKPHTAYLAFEADVALRHIESYHPVNFCDLVQPFPFNS